MRTPCFFSREPLPDSPRPHNQRDERTKAGRWTGVKRIGVRSDPFCRSRTSSFNRTRLSLFHVQRDAVQRRRRGFLCASKRHLTSFGFRVAKRPLKFVPSKNRPEPTARFRSSDLALANPRNETFKTRILSKMKCL